MRTLSVELKPASRPSRWAWGLLCLVLLLAGAAIAASLYRHQDLERIREQLREIARLQNEPVVPAVVAPRRAPYDASAREMLAEATSQWPAMLTALETVAVPGVTPTSVEIVASEGQVRIDVEFSDYAALLRYLDDLNAGEPVPRWALVQAQGLSRAQATQGAPAPAIAQIRGEWKR